MFDVMCFCPELLLLNGSEERDRLQSPAENMETLDGLGRSSLDLVLLLGLLIVLVLARVVGLGLVLFHIVVRPKQGGASEQRYQSGS